MPVEAVIFDIGNVLIEWRPERYFDARIGPDRRTAFFDAVDIHAMMNRIDGGEDFAAEVARTARAHPDWTAEVLAFRDDWCGIAQPAIPGSVHLLERLKARGVPVFALSNFGAVNFPMSVAQFPFLDLFDRRYVSGAMGMRKPHEEIYAAVEADCGLAPDRLLFTDDRDDNIAAASARGWQVHRFEGADGLHARLMAEGVLE